MMKHIVTIGTVMILGIGLAMAKGYHKHRYALLPAPIIYTPTFGNSTTQFQPARDLSVCPGYGFQGGLCDRSVGSH